MRISAKAVFRVLLILLILLTLTFIFSNSLKSQDASSADSDAVGGFIATLFPPETPLGAFIQDNLRSIAHFAEFALLGFEIALYVAFFTEKRLIWALISPLFGLVTAIVDEFIQSFNDRAPELGDVLLDFAGFTTFAVLTYLVLTLAAYIKYRMDENKIGE